VKNDYEHEYDAWALNGLEEPLKNKINEILVRIAGLLAEMHAGNQKNMKQRTAIMCMPIFRLGICSVVYVATTIW
jgi:hypothetical protein